MASDEETASSKLPLTGEVKEKGILSYGEQEEKTCKGSLHQSDSGRKGPEREQESRANFVSK